MQQSEVYMMKVCLSVFTTCPWNRVTYSGMKEKQMADGQKVLSEWNTVLDGRPVMGDMEPDIDSLSGMVRKSTLPSPSLGYLAASSTGT